MKINFEKINNFLLPYQGNNYRPLILEGRFFQYLALMLIFLQLINIFYLIIFPRTHFFADVSREALIQLANNERRMAGLPLLTENPKLSEAARLKAEDMVKRDYFSHWGPDGTSPWHWFRLAGYNYKHAGENLAIGFFSAQDVHNDWIDSPTHRDNILGMNFEEIGVAVVKGEFYGHNTFLAVQVFGQKRVNEEIVSQPVIELSEEITPTLETTPTLEVTPTLKAIPPQEPITLPVKEEISEELILPEKETITPLVTTEEAHFISPKITENNELTLSIFKFLMLEYSDLLRQITLFSILFIGFVLVINIFVKFNVQHPDLIFKGLGFLFLFFLFGYFEQVMLSEIINQEIWIG